MKTLNWHPFILMTFCVVAGACAMTSDEDSSPGKEIDAFDEQAISKDDFATENQPEQQAPAHASAHHSTACYEVVTSTGVWLPEVCDNQIVVPYGGMKGLSVTLRGTSRDVVYQAYYGGAWGPPKENGAFVGNLQDLFKAVRILISPRQQAHICYDLIDTSFNMYSKCDNDIAGIESNTADDLRYISIKYTP